jgi:excisionase family DNA binding protein
MATRPTPSPHVHAAGGGSPNTNDGAVSPRTEVPLLAEPLLTADDVASLLRVPRSTVYELTRSRRLPYVKVGRRTLFVRSDLDAWIVASRVMPLN